MLGYCGINCHNCPAYQGTVNHDMTLLEKAASTYENSAYSAQEWVCLGCTPANQPFLAKFCAKCKIRTCAVTKNVPNCAACNDFETCSELHNFINNQSENHIQTMNLLHKRYLDLQRNKES